jgi:hypothetical protein
MFNIQFIVYTGSTLRWKVAIQNKSGMVFFSPDISVSSGGGVFSFSSPNTTCHCSRGPLKVHKIEIFLASILKFVLFLY